jgi:hypothetical protein
MRGLAFILIVFSALPLFAEGPPKSAAVKKALNFNPVPSDPTKKSDKSLRTLEKGATICEVGAAHYAVHDSLDEDRCVQRAGKVKVTTEKTGPLTDIKMAPLPASPDFKNQPMNPQQDRMYRNIHHDPVGDH